MPRILHIIDSLGRNGATQQLRLLAHGLVRQGFDVHIGVLSPIPPKAIRCGEVLQDGTVDSSSSLRITYLGRRFPLDPLADLRLVRLVTRLQPHIVHTWNTVPGMFGPVASRFLRRYFTGGATPQLIACRNRIDCCRPAWEARFERSFARHAAGYVTNSQTVREWCAAHGLPAEKFTVIPSGVPSARPSDVLRADLLRELHLPPDARLIGVIGRLVPEKRVRELIWAADLLRVLHDNLRMLIIGTGPLRTELEQYARLASDLDHIRFLGERDDVWRIMPHLDVLWNGSDNRSVSITMLEAMAAGVPVVASDVPVNRELVIHGETGYLIPLAHRSGRADRARHTERIFSDTTLAARLGTASTQHANCRFKFDCLVQQHVNLYQTSTN
jgi:glycosyltransferase involved in cell wall biosynthesis